MNKDDNLPEVNRRNFLKNTSLATVMAMMGGVELQAQEASKPAADAGGSALTVIPPDPTVKFGVIGLGEWGREIVKELALLPNTPIVALCDKRESAMHHAAENAPKAAQYAEYEKLLGDPNVEAVVIATPTNHHTAIALAALKAGKNVYCEAPLANTIEDAKAIAVAARDAAKVVFQPGLQERSHPERHFLMPYIRSGAVGENVMVRAQSHQNKSWEASPWKTQPESSIGLIGEVGIHQIDAVAWFLRKLPVAVSGFGGRMCQHAGDIADTVQCVFDFPGSLRFMYDATLCNSFDKDYEVYYGTQTAIMVRDGKAWMFYEPDAQLGGWEVYAHKDDFYKETGIALSANATKQSAIGTSATAKSSTAPDSPLHYALKEFAKNVGQIRTEWTQYLQNFGDDPKGFDDYRKTLKMYGQAATWREGLDATILAIKANEAVVQQQKVAVDKALFDL